MYNEELAIRDRLKEILESIELIQEWSNGMTELHDFMVSPGRVMAFNACVMRFQVIGEHVGKLMKEEKYLCSVNDEGERKPPKAFARDKSTLIINHLKPF